MAKKKKPKVKRKLTGKRGKPKKPPTRKVVLPPVVPIVSDDEALERAYSF
jgi:hypothetical protein